MANQVYHFDNSQRGAAFSSNRVYLATGDGATVSIYDVNNGERVWHKDVGYSINAVSFDSNGQYLATGDTKTDLIIWEVSSGEIIRRMDHAYDVYAVNFTPDGKYLIAGGADNKLTIWEISSGQSVHEKSYGTSTKMKHSKGALGCLSNS